MSPPSVPPQVPSSGRPLPSAGSSGASSPASPVLSADSDFSPPLAPRFVSFARHYHRLAPVRSPRRDVASGAWTTSTAAPAPPLNGGENETSQVPGRPLCVHASLFDPGGPPTPGHYRNGDVVFRWINGVDSATVLSRLYHAACTLSVYASQPGSPPNHATLDSGWWPALAGQDSHLLGRVEGFQHVCPLHRFPPSPSFAWRTNPTLAASGARAAQVVGLRSANPTYHLRRVSSDSGSFLGPLVLTRPSRQVPCQGGRVR